MGVAYGAVKDGPAVSGLWEFLKASASVPQIQVWFLVGVIAGFFFWLSDLRTLRSISIVTALVVGPPVWQFIRYQPNKLDEIDVLLAMIYLMIGFVGFSLGWIPGLLLGYGTRLIYRLIAKV